MPSKGWSTLCLRSSKLPEGNALPIERETFLWVVVQPVNVLKHSVVLRTVRFEQREGYSYEPPKCNCCSHFSIQPKQLGYLHRANPPTSVWQGHRQCHT